MTPMTQQQYFLKSWLSILLICDRHISTTVTCIIIVIIVISTTVTNDRMQEVISTGIV